MRALLVLVLGISCKELRRDTSFYLVPLDAAELPTQETLPQCPEIADAVRSFLLVWENAERGGEFNCGARNGMENLGS